MRRVVAAVGVLLLVALVALTAGDPDVAVEQLSVEVPERPGSEDVVGLDVALHLPASTPAPAVLLAHGFGSDRTALDATARLYAGRGYVALTWSSRGFGRSGGVVGLLDPDREVADVSALVDLLASRPEVAREPGPQPGDPVVGIAGGSYGGGLALLAAVAEPRLDAVVAAGAWHDLARALSPPEGLGGVLAEQRLAGLVAGLIAQGGADAAAGPADADAAPPAPTGVAAEGPAVACGRLDPALCRAYVATMRAGEIRDPSTEVLLDRASIRGDAARIAVPTLLVAGQEDTLFPLGESLSTAALVPEVAVRWVAGGHGAASRVDTAAALAWFDLHLRGRGTPPPAFTWTDVVGDVERTGDRIPPPGEPPPDEPPSDEPPPDETSPALDLVLGEGGRLAPADAGASPAEVTLRFPPGGVPRAVPGLGGLPDLGTAGPGAGGGVGPGGLGALAGLLAGGALPGQAAAWTSAPRVEPLVLLGPPRLELAVDASRPMELFVQVQDVTPGGRATVLSGAATPVRVRAGTGEVVVDLAPVARRVVPGNRVRVVVGTTDLVSAQGRSAAVAVVGGGRLRVPTTTVEAPSSVPVAVRLAAPVLVLLALAAVAAVLTRRHEAAMAREPADPGAPAVVVSGLRKRYPDGHVAVDGVDLTVERGQVVGLLGPNGAGKTTTMRTLLGLIRPTAGEVRIHGHRVRPGHPVLGRVGVLVEGPGFAPHLTGRQNLTSWWRAGGRPDAEADWATALDTADLGAALDKPVRTYSHGMRQRLALAQALLGRPDLLVLDEPTDGLDPEQIRGVRRLLARLGEAGLPVLVSSHLLAEVEQMCTHAVVVDRGRVVAAGPVAELRGSSRSILVEVDDRDAARKALAGVVRPGGATDAEGAGLVVDLDGTDAPAVVAALVHAGVAVRAVTPRGRLEDAFLALTAAGAAGRSGDAPGGISSPPGRRDPTHTGHDGTRR